MEIIIFILMFLSLQVLVWYLPDLYSRFLGTSKYREEIKPRGKWGKILYLLLFGLAFVVCYFYFFRIK